MGGAGGIQARRNGGDRSTHLILIAGFVSQDSVDNRNVSVSEMSNVLMGQIDDLSQLFVIAYRVVTVLVHVRFDSGDARLIASEEIAEVLFGLLRVAGTATWNEIAESMLAHCLLVDWHDVIHDEFAFGFAIGAGAAEFFDNRLPMFHTELFVPEPAEDIANKKVLRDANCIALVAPAWGACSGFTRNLVLRGVKSQVNGLNTLLSKVFAKQGEAVAGRRIEPLAGHTDGDAVHDVFMAPIPNVFCRADLRHGPTERVIDIKGIFRILRILKLDELGWILLFAILENSRYAVLDVFSDLHEVTLGDW